MNDRPIGPDPETLRNLSEALPSFVEHTEEKRAFKGQPAITQSTPTKTCKVCCRMFDHKLVAPGAISIGTCPKCAKLFKKGYTALVCADRYAFVKSPRLPAGEIMEVSVEVMEKVHLEFKLEWETKEKPDDKAPNPPSNN